MKTVRCEYAPCGAELVIAKLCANSKRFCSARCRKAKRRDDARSGRVITPSAIRPQSAFKEFGGRALAECFSPLHEGKSVLPLAEFYVWALPSGREVRSNWCRRCLKSWLVINDMSDKHGQHTEADDAARLELYEARLKTFRVIEGGVEVDAIGAALRLAVRRGA